MLERLLQDDPQPIGTEPIQVHDTEENDNNDRNLTQNHDANGTDNELTYIGLADQDDESVPFCDSRYDTDSDDEIDDTIYPRNLYDSDSEDNPAESNPPPRNGQTSSNTTTSGHREVSNTENTALRAQATQPYLPNERSQTSVPLDDII